MQGWTGIAMSALRDLLHTNSLTSTLTKIRFLMQLSKHFGWHTSSLQRLV
jgi:hypothetical protein